MSIASGVFDFFSEFISGLSEVFATNHDAYIRAEAIDDERTFVSRNGDLSTVLELHGYKSVISGEDFNILMNRLYDVLLPSLFDNGRYVRIIFKRDPDEFNLFMDENEKASLSSSHAVSLNLDDVIKSHNQAVSNYCSFETVYIVLGTRMAGVLTSSEVKVVAKEMLNVSSQSMYGRDSQQIIHVAQAVRHAHESFWNGVLSDLSGAGFIVSPMSVYDVLHMIRLTLAPSRTSPSWSARLMSKDTKPVTYPRESTSNSEQDASHVMLPRIASQLLPDGAGEMLNARLQRMGDRYFAPTMITLFPEAGNVKPFQILFNSMSSSGHIPYMVGFHMDSGRNIQFGIKQTVTQIINSITFQSSLVNRQIVDSIAEINERMKSETFMRMRISALTWGANENQALERQSILMRAMQSWGGCETSDVVGDPLGGVFALMPGINDYNPAPVTVAPMREVLPMLPMTRIASPWRTGSLLLRTPDGKALPFQPGSSMQAAWVNLIFAPMGFGKSVFLNAFNLATTLLPGATQLPIIRIMDIGVSSSGLVSLIKYALPEAMRHLVQYYRLSLDNESAINVFDMPLGLRKPLPDHRAFLINFIAMLCTPMDREAPHEGVYGMARALVNTVYDRFSPEGTPKPYQERINLSIQEIVKDLTWPDGSPFIDGKTTWWEVVDRLYSDGYIHEAMIAQRHAVPTLNDLIPMCSDTSITNTYGVLNGIDLPRYVWQMINEAIDSYPNLSGYTRFDIGDARIVSLDLQDVTRGDGPAAERRTSIMYMTARYILTRDFQIIQSDIRHFPELYQAFHGDRFEKMQTEIKSLCLDEFHRTSKSEGLRNQIETDIREGRKWRMMITLVSQRPQDFSSTMVDLSSSVFILGGGSNEMVKELGNIFGLSDTELYIIANRITKPDHRGSSMLVKHKTAMGEVSQYAMLTLAPEEMWAFTTTAEDRALRDKLYQKFSPSKVRAALSKQFPKGSCVGEIERRKQALSSNSMDETHDVFADILMEMERVVSSMDE